MMWCPVFDVERAIRAEALGNATTFLDMLGGTGW
jgi:hypothetical protein